MAGVGRPRLLRFLLETLTRDVVVAVWEDVAGVGVYRSWKMTTQVVLRWWIMLARRLSRRIGHSRPSRKESAKMKQISNWSARVARRTTTLASARSSEGLSRPFHIAEPLPMG